MNHSAQQNTQTNSISISIRQLAQGRSFAIIHDITFMLPSISFLHTDNAEPNMSTKEMKYQRVFGGVTEEQQ